MAHQVMVLAKTDLVKYMLSQPLLRGRLSQWSLHLLQFDIGYVSQNAVKGQALADFLADHPCVDVSPEEEDWVLYVNLVPWRLYFVGSNTSKGA